MTNKELRIIANALFGSPCNYSPMDEELVEDYIEWCEQNCERAGDDQSLQKYIKFKLEEKQNESNTCN